MSDKTAKRAPKLMPCPFCGSRKLERGWLPEGWLKTTLRWVMCRDCNGTASSPEAWNRRPT